MSICAKVLFNERNIGSAGRLRLLAAAILLIAPLPANVALAAQRRSHGQVAARVQPAPRPSAALGPLKTVDGPNGETLDAIYKGAFEELNLDRSSTDFANIGDGYINAFSRLCLQYLPANRIEIMQSVCDSYWVTRNGWGTEISRTCSSSHLEGTGVFADPELYGALQSAPIQSAAGKMRTLVDMFTRPDGLSGAVDMTRNLVQLNRDAQSLVQQNGCISPALRRFQNNIVRFALGKDGLRLDGSVKTGVALLGATAGGTYQDSDYGRLLNDMVIEQSKTWAFNRYVPNSIGGAHVITRDGGGRPAKVLAEYSYVGLSSQQSGTVTLEFEAGKPTCLYFSDQPGACRTPSYGLTAAYVQGRYR